MVEIQQAKVRCEIEFCTLLQGAAISGPFQCVFELFEHQYDSATHFWWGVTEIPCAADELREAVEVAGDWDQLELAITFSDGRFGAARVKSWQNNSNSVHIAATGWSKLQ